MSFIKKNWWKSAEFNLSAFQALLDMANSQVKNKKTDKWQWYVLSSGSTEAAYTVWYYRLWSFLAGGYKIRKIFASEPTSLKDSAEPEPSWLEPQLELKDFQLGSARDLFP